MKVIVCIDDRYGMFFAGRRVSSDKKVTERIALLAQTNRVWMNEYSAKLFSNRNGIAVDEEFLDRMEAADYCFIEGTDISGYLGKITGLTVYRWNRRYPSDIRFPFEEITADMKLVSREDFEGNSHKRITEERYVYEEK